MLAAVTLATILEPHGKENGAALNYPIGTEHCVTDRIPDVEPSQ